MFLKKEIFVLFLHATKAINFLKMTQFKSNAFFTFRSECKPLSLKYSFSLGVANFCRM